MRYTEYGCAISSAKFRNVDGFVDAVIACYEQNGIYMFCEIFCYTI
jgi:hypothetical protein